MHLFNKIIQVKYFDENAEIASRGTISKELLQSLKDHPFFNQAFPKTTGPELFNLNYLQQAQSKSLTESLNNDDVLATLNRFFPVALASSPSFGSRPRSGSVPMMVLPVSGEPAKKVDDEDQHDHAAEIAKPPGDV